MKTMIYEDENIIVYKKGIIDIGYEATTADSLVVASIFGYRSFGEHLEDPKDFYQEVLISINELFNDTLLSNDDLKQ